MGIRYPTIEDLREILGIVAGGGRDRVDSKEFFSTQFYEPLEIKLYETLRKQYPEMAVTDAIVCRDIYIRIRTITAKARYDHVMDRMGIWCVDTIPVSDWPQYCFEHREALLNKNYPVTLGSCNTVKDMEGYLKEFIAHAGIEHTRRAINPFEHNEGDSLRMGDDYIQEEIAQSIYLANKHGYISFHTFPHEKIIVPGGYIELRQDIIDTLDELVDQECKASDEALIAGGHGPEMEYLSNIMWKRNQAIYENAMTIEEKWQGVQEENK
jgi:hypothetical protein